MYLQMLKKDLKRKKTMNIILLIFIMLSTVFVASSVNNIVTITNALDYYFEKAGVPDYFVATMNKADTNNIAKTLDNVQEVEDYGIEEVLYASPENFYHKNERIKTMQNSSIIMPIDYAQITYFDKNNNAIETVKPGEVFVAVKVLKKNNLSVGDEIEVRMEGVSVKVKIAGACKDAMLGSDLMGMNRFLLNKKDYDKLVENETVRTMYSGDFYYINTSDTEAVAKAIGEESSIVFGDDIEVIKKTYVMDMVIAGVLLVVSVCLILIAFVVLRFTIVFTLTEEYREIGVMKAIGIRNTKIRGLYMVKYLALAILGAVVGFFASIPFGNMLVQSVSESMVLGNDNSILMNVLCSLGIIAVILSFCFHCTGKVKKFTPIDAIRNGTTGERFSKKSLLRLKNVKAKPAIFMALNDVLSSPKRFVTVILTYTLCLTLVLILANTVNTLRSGELTHAFGVLETHVFYTDDTEAMSFLTEEGRELVEKRIQEIEETLKDNGMPATCTLEMIFKPNVVFGKNSFKSQMLQGIGTTTDQYRYFEGTAPQNVNEIAVTPLTAKKLGAKIGDTVVIQHDSGDREYMITGLFQSMNNMGEGVRLHEDVEIDLSQANGLFPFQIEFEDNPDEETIRERIKIIKELFDTDNVQTAGEYVESMVGVAGVLNGLKFLVLALVMIIVMLVTVLMERSFIAKERGEIALLKAVGFRTKTIVKWHTMRFVVISTATTIVSLLLAKPMTMLSVNPVFKMMGAGYGVEYKIVPWEVYVMYPVTVFAITVLSGVCTSLYTKKITASEASSIE